MTEAIPEVFKFLINIPKIHIDLHYSLIKFIRNLPCIGQRFASIFNYKFDCLKILKFFIFLKCTKLNQTPSRRSLNHIQSQKIQSGEPNELNITHKSDKPPLNF